MFKRLFLIALTVSSLSTAVYASKQITQFQDLQQALVAGHNVKMVIDNSKCSPPIPGMVAGIDLSPFIIYQNKVMKVINTLIKVKSGNYVNEYVAITISNDGAVTVQRQLINPTNNLPIDSVADASPFTDNCKISDGGVVLYDLSQAN